jgi:hypothetical protein
MADWRPALTELFPDGDYEFHLTLRRARPEEFFAPLDASGAMLRERSQWVDTAPEIYLGHRDEAEPAVAEFTTLARAWEFAPAQSGRAVADWLRWIGCSLEPDTLFLAPGPDRRFRLVGGALCFPTGWALQEKLGGTLDAIHGVVPGLNAALAAPIEQFLSKLKPGSAYLRHNWGLAANNELNQHPARQLRPPQRPVRLDRLWLRVEHQALFSLPQSGGIVFAIRIAHHRLDDIAAGPAAPGLRRALETMPDELASYKRISEIRRDVIGLL